MLDRFPGLRFVLAHGGGYVPYQLGRFWFDTILFDPLRLDFLAEAVGAERVVLGTDCPFALGDPSAIDRVRAAPALAKDLPAVLGRNTLALLGE